MQTHINVLYVVYLGTYVALLCMTILTWDTQGTNPMATSKMPLYTLLIA